MPKKSTADVMFALSVLMEKYRGGQNKLHCVFVALKKANNRVPRAVVLREEYMRMVKDMYEESKTVVGVLGPWSQGGGSDLTPFLFAVVMHSLTDEVRGQAGC